MTRTSETVVIPPRYQGPPGSANGGYVAGLLAASLGPSASVRLEAAVPLATDLDLRVGDDETELVSGGQRLAVAHRHEGPEHAVAPVPVAEAEAAVPWTAERHPFPGCFVCGPAAVDGLHVWPGAVDDGTTVAMTWTVPDPAEVGLDGERLAWAVLDCPSGIAAMADGEAAVLGTLTARVTRPLVGGDALLVVGRRVASEGRKRLAGSALFDPDGTPVAWAESVWIVVEP